MNVTPPATGEKRATHLKGTLAPAAPPPGLASVNGKSGLSRFAFPESADADAKTAGVRFELGALAALLLLTGVLGRTFSKLELGFSWLHPTELVLVAVLAAALLRTSPRAWADALRETRTLVPLLVLWFFGALAIARGLLDWGFTRVLYDVGLVEYSVLIVLLALVVRNRSELVWLCRMIALAGLLAIAAMAASAWAPADWEVGSSLSLIAAASGLYATFYIAWVVARAATGVRVRPWEYTVAMAAVGLVFLGSARSAWVGVLVVLASATAFAAPGHRSTFAGRVAAMLMLGIVLSTGFERIQLLEIPSPSTAATQLLTSVELDRAEAPAANRAGIGPVAARQATPRDEPDQAAPAPPRDEPDQAAPATPADEPDPAVAPSGGGGTRPANASASRGPDPVFESQEIELGSTLDDYASFGSNVLAASAAFTRAEGPSLKAIYRSDLRLATTHPNLPLVAGAPHLVSAWVYIPSSWDGGEITVGTDGTWAGAAEATSANSTRAKGRWTRIDTELTPRRDDLVGGVHIRAAAPPSPGQAVYVDEVTVRPGAGTELAPPVEPAGELDAGGNEPNGFEELTASFQESPQQANASWRLAFWEFVLQESAQNPVLGVGFGRPSDFEWSGIRYDRRTGDTDDPFDVTGPHNSFLNLLYRTGLPGFLALVAIMLIAVARLLPVARRAGRDDRAIAVWLLVALAAATAAASFTVALEGPFMGIFFWAVLGLGLVAPQFLGDGSTESKSQPGPARARARARNENGAAEAAPSLPQIPVSRASRQSR